MSWLGALAAKPVRRIAGLMSGTSVDGIDCAICQVEGAGPGVGVELLGFWTYPFEPAVRERIFQAFDSAGARELCELNFLLGEAFADAVLRSAAKAGLDPGALDLVASPGQTIYHIPKASSGITSTLQLGEASVIAERTGLPVVCDLRVRDVAAGGEGAPLVPYADYLLFHEPGTVRAVQNLGGIANVTIVAERLEQMLAFDTGPGNMVIDRIAQAVAGDEAAFDEDGKLSALGAVDEPLLERLLLHPFFRLQPPRSTGREAFGAAYAQELVDDYDPLRLLDLLATAVELTVESIAGAYERFVFPRHEVHEVLLAGGGSHNRSLVEKLRERLAPLPVRTLDEIGLSADAKEAVSFALLANETVAHQPSNVPAATGARRLVVLGKLVPPSL